MKNLLLTLSALVSIESKKIEAIRKEYKERLLLWKPTPDVMGAIATSYDTICLHSELLEKTVELKHLVACGQDGKPITEPVPGDWFDTNKKLSDFSIADTAGFGLYGNKLNDYQEALKSVIFVGWEVVINSSDGVTVTNKEAELTFTGKNLIITTNISGEHWTDLECINTFEDLATKTESNPLELRS